MDNDTRDHSQLSTEEERSLRDSIAHFQKLMTKRKALDSAARDCADQIFFRSRLMDEDSRLSLLGALLRVSETHALETSPTLHGLITGSSASLSRKIRDRVKAEDLSTPGSTYEGRLPFGNDSQAELRVLRLLGGAPCVYQLRNRNGAIVYVGQTRRIRERLKAHWKDASKHEAGPLGSYVVQVCASIEEAREVERSVIETLVPTLNKQFTFRAKTSGSWLS